MLPQMSSPQTWYNLLHLAIAYALSLPVANDRERTHKTVGLQTFPLVAVAACSYTLVGISALDSTDAETRILQGLIMSTISFLTLWLIRQIMPSARSNG